MCIYVYRIYHSKQKRSSFEKKYPWVDYLFFISNCNRYLHNNKITQLTNGLFDNMVSLKRLRLDSNEIVCNCNILWLLKLLKKSAYIEAEINCKHPANVRGKSLSDLNESDLDCSKWKLPNNIHEFR